MGIDIDLSYYAPKKIHMVLVSMAKPGLLLYPTDFIFLSVKCCDHCDRIFINTLLDLKISFIVYPMESVDFSVRDVIDILWWSHYFCPYSANNHITELPCSNEHSA